MSNSIVLVNVSLQIAPTPATLQKMGAFVSYGGTITSPGTDTLLTQLSDLTPWLPLPSAIASATWATNTVSVTTQSNHNLPVGQQIWLYITGFTPVGYNGIWLCTITGVNTFTYILNPSPGAATVMGTWQTRSAYELIAMATTFFAQGFAQSVYILELGASDVNTAIANLSAYITQNPNSNYTPGATGFFYSYLLPREFDANTNLLNLLQSYESPTSRTYFYITSTLATYTVYTQLQKDAIVLIESPAWGTWIQNPITAANYASGIVNYTTTIPHGIQVGQWFQMAGFVPNAYNGWFQAGQGTTGSNISVRFASNPGAVTTEGTLVASLYNNAGVTPTEFSLAAAFYVALNYAPSSTNRVTPYQFSFVYGVTPFPTRFNNSLLSTLRAGFINYIDTGAEGGISSTILKWGSTMDGNKFNYWYSVDWTQINLDLNTANAVINGSNNPINPLYYNQPGIDALQAVAASTMNQGITYGLVLGAVTLTALDPITLDQNLDLGIYADRTVVNAVPFVIYSLENPSDYKIGRYAGLGIVYMPQQGFDMIIYNVVVTELIAQ